METNSNSKTTNKTIISIIIGIIVFIIGFYILMSAFYFKNAFLPNTYVNGTELSYLNKDKALLRLNKNIEEYVLVLTDNDKINEKIYATDIELMYNIDDEISNVIKNQNTWLWGVKLFSNTQIELSNNIKYNEKYLNDKINSFDFIANSGETVGEPAKIVYENDKYVIKNGKHGDKVDKDAFTLSIKDCILNLKNEADLNEIICFVQSEYNDKNPTIINSCNTANKYLNTKITIDLGQENGTTVIDKETINKWLCIDDKYNVFFDRVPIEEYVKAYAEKFNTYGKTRSFLTAHGVYENVAGGDFGWLINNDKEVDAIVTAIKAGNSETRTPVCYYTGLGHGDKDWGDTYIEVDLTNQHMYVWVKGERVMDSDVVTGTPIPSRITPPGTYSVKAKMKNAILRGDNYRTPVSYWMPFNKGIGFHDATWQRAFGGTRYKNGYGSHGCVNLSLKVAKQLYEYVYVGIPVICYHTSAKGIAPLTTTEATTQATTSTVTTAKPVQVTTVKPITQATTVKPVSQTTTVKPATTQATTMAITQATTAVTTQTTTEAVTEATTTQITTKAETTTAVSEITETTTTTAKKLGVKEKEVITQ